MWRKRHAGNVADIILDHCGKLCAGPWNYDIKNRARFALNFLVRAVLGACTIACVNKWLAQQGIMLAVGINPVTLLTTGSLGFSGVALLYGILLLKIL